MIRKLAIALSLLGVCFAGLVHALGLGEVTIKSALNQPLNAKIELVNTAGLTINEILPGLATREEFQKANVDRVYFLSDLRFEVITRSQGKAIIVLTSKKPVREPFLNFIVELIWPSGRLLREYALLIDPPLFSDQPVANINSSTANTKELISGDVLNISNNSNSSATPSSRSLLAPPAKIETGTYGATSTNDTLWDIAIKARPNRSVSPQQVMLAIQDLNPNAFMDNNINKLKAGQVLRLPSIEEIKQRSQHQAIISVIAQNEALTGKRAPSVVQGSDTKDLGSSSAQNKSVKSGGRVPGDELKLIVSDSGSNATSNSANSGQSKQSGSGAANDLAITLEKLDKASIENKELNGRVSDLEEQLSTLQRLLTLKNDQLSAIQTQMRTNELEKLKAQNESEVAIDESENLSEEPINSAQNEALEQVNEQSDTEVMEGAEKNIEGAPGLNEAEEKMAENNVALSEAKAVIPTSKETYTQKNTSQVPSQNIMQVILNNPLYLGVSLVSVFVLVVLLWLVSRYNARREEEFQTQNTYNGDEFDEPESNTYLDSGDNFEDDDLDTQTQDSFDEEENFESSDETSDYSSEPEGESQDILAEVNAYISYGRLDQASSVLEKAISSDPVRTDYRLKLLSIYKELGDRQAFDRQFSELEAIQDRAATQKAEKIRAELLQEDSLALDADDPDLNFDSKSDNVEPESSDDSDIDEELKSFDFDSVSLEDEEQDLDLTSELDLDGLDIGDLEQEDLNALSSETDDSLEVDDVLALDMNSLDVDESKDELESNDFDDSILDVELEDLDLNAELDQESEIALAGDNDEQDLLSSDSNEELVVSDDILEEAAQAFEEESTAFDEDLSDADDFDFLNGTDEASTKLDLARAYIDMGDIDGAKDILLEVTKEGSDAQQAEAKELIDSLD